MVAANDAPLGTAFTVTVDVKHGLTTGISAEQRTNTVRALANHNMGAADFVRPGHVFPLVAEDGGVLMRSGHTEAAVDLCKLAGLPPVGVICELANDDGTVMRGEQIDAFAEKHGLKRISVADLIAYRQSREKLVERIASFPGRDALGIVHGLFLFDAVRRVQHVALVHGRIGDGKDIPVRLHRANAIADIFEGGKAINAAMQRFVTEGRGVLVYLRDGTAGVPTTNLNETRRDRIGGHALEPMARDRPRRADPAGPRRRLDPQSCHIEQVLRGVERLRHRACGRGAARYLVDDLTSARLAMTNIARSECASVRWPHCEKSRLKLRSCERPSYSFTLRS